MKLFSKRFLGIAFCVATLGAAASFAALSNGHKNEVKVAEASTPSSYAKVYRFTAPASWTACYAYAWGSGTSSNNIGWPGTNISNQYSYNENSRKVYTFTTNVSDYQYLIFHNNSGWQTDNITIGNNTAWYLDDGNTPGTWTPTNQTYYLYDYRGLFGGNAKCYAWQSNGSLNNGSYPGVAMTAVQYGSGQLYSVSLDPAFDEVIFSIGDDSTKTDDLWCNQKRGQCYCFWETSPAWSADLDWVKAHDWIYNTMHVRDIQTTTTTDTGACRGANGYYQKAKTAYQNYSSAIKTKMSEDECWSAAQTRFVAWAKANGETASFSGTSLTVNGNQMISPILNSKNNPLLLTVLGSIVVIVAGAFFFYHSKKESIN